MEKDQVKWNSNPQNNNLFTHSYSNSIDTNEPGFQQFNQDLTSVNAFQSNGQQQYFTIKHPQKQDNVNFATPTNLGQSSTPQSSNKSIELASHNSNKDCINISTKMQFPNNQSFQKSDGDVDPIQELKIQLDRSQSPFTSNQRQKEIGSKTSRQSKSKDRLNAQDLMSSYIFKNAQKGKVSTISPNKLTKFITNNNPIKQSQQQQAVKRSITNKQLQNAERQSKSPIRESKTTQSKPKTKKSRNSSPYNSTNPEKSEANAASIKKKVVKSPTKYDKISTQTDDLGPPLKKTRSRTPEQAMKPSFINKKFDEEFKNQFMQYLDVLKEKVAEMELKVKESQHEKFFYKQKFQESYDQLQEKRDKEKEYTIQIAQLSQKCQHIQDKADKKKKLIQSMQSTLCNLSVNLEISRRELEECQNSKSCLNNKIEFHRDDSFSASSVNKVIGQYQNPKIDQNIIEDQNFQQMLQEKLDLLNITNKDRIKALNQEEIYKRANSENISNSFEFNLNDGITMLANIEDKDFITFLDEDQNLAQERKEKFRAFARRYGLDQVIHLSQFLGSRGSLTPISPQLKTEASCNVDIDSEMDFFIRFIVKKLQAEQRNRLKTEEQSAQVIEQLGKTITRLELKKVGGAQSKYSSSTPQNLEKQESQKIQTHKSANTFCDIEQV